MLPCRHRLGKSGDDAALAVQAGDVLKTQVLAVVRAQRAWVPREDVPRLLARWLGFGRTGARIVDATESVLRGLVRSGDLQSQDGAVRPA